MRYLVLLACAMLICRAGLAEGTATPSSAKPGVTQETVVTSDGIFLLWHRTPAQAVDVGMPVLHDSLTLESFAYRVRDRKRRDLLQYARMRLATTAPLAAVTQFYCAALGKAVVQSTNKENGEVTLAAGSKDNLRMVTITPQEKNCHIRLERTVRYTIPPRIFTAGEQQVIRVLTEVGHTYQSARQVRLTAVQHTVLLDQKAPGKNPPDVTWTYDFSHPDRLQISATTGTKSVLTMTTSEGNLIVTAPQRQEEKRPIEGKITTELVPEIQDDPVARLMLGESLIIPALDFLSLDAMPGAAAGRQVKIALTYPDKRAKLFLIVDLQQKTILRSEMLTDEEDFQLRVERVYQDLQLIPPTTAPHAALSQQQSPPVPAAVHAP